MAEIDFTSPTSTQAIENALKSTMPELELQEPVVSGTTKSLTITSRSDNVDKEVLGELAGDPSSSQPGIPRQCHSCGREAGDGIRFCLGYGADLDSPPPITAADNPWPRQTPKITNDSPHR